MIVVRGQEGKAKAEMRTCDEHVVPACTYEISGGEYLELCIILP